MKFFQFLSLTGRYPDITLYVKNEKEDSEFIREYFSSAQINDVVESCLSEKDPLGQTSLKGLRDACMILLMASTGLRTTSVSSANAGDLRRVGDSHVLFYRGKGRAGKNEIVHLPYELEKMIRQYLKKRGNAGSDDPLFASLSNNSSGKRLATRGIRYAITERFRAVGLDFDEHRTVDSLRSSCIIIGLENDNPLEQMRQVVGLHSLEQTAHYQRPLSHLNNNSEQTIFNAIRKRGNTMTQLILNLSDSTAKLINRQAKQNGSSPETIIESWAEKIQEIERQEASKKGLEAFDALCAAFQENGLADITMDEIDEIIAESRAERKARRG